jgi:EAL domain-containing protein (putative c-di-GMP-specific phosphodiesterase class I)
MTSQLQMQMADIAMYNAKKMGRNQYCFFNDEMKAKVQNEFMIGTQLPLAIRQEQFRLVYQPIFTATTMECNKTEVLVRWGDGGSEEYCPDMFIPIAEKAGSMVELGRWITRQALEELSPWLQESPKNILSINVSQVQLQSKGFAADFIDLVSKAAVKNQQIELELSENIVATGIDINVAENINELRQSGFQFAFDDFGTGSSSLLHLQKFPGNCLKIDKSFIIDIMTNDEQHRLVAGMIDFAHHLGMHVVAEGVETQQQIDSLIDLGSDYLQGFLLAKPCPADKVLAILDRCYGTPNDHARAAGF